MAGLLGGESEDGDGAGFGADEEADTAPGATGATVFGGMVAVMIEALGEVQGVWRAGFHAKSTTLTFFGI
jgi:hypothetical protein